MTPAELKTAHEGLGLSTEYIARRIGVTVGRVWAYEHPSRTAAIPDHAAEVMRDLLNDREAAVATITEHLRGEHAEVIQRHASLAAFYAEHPDLNGWGGLAHGLILAEVQRRLQLPIEYVAA